MKIFKILATALNVLNNGVALPRGEKMLVDLAVSELDKLVVKEAAKAAVKKPRPAKVAKAPATAAE